MQNKKEPLLIMTVKTLLAVVIFTGVGTIIIGGGYIIGDYYKYKNAIDDQIIKPVVQEVIITTDKTEYEQGENTIITIRNNFDKNIYYYENIYCYLEYQKENGIWAQSLIINISCLKGEIKGLHSFKSTNRTLYFTGNNHIYYSGGGKYRLAFSYGYSNKNTKEEIIYSDEFTIEEKLDEKAVIEKVGRVCVVGNEPFTNLALEVEDGKTHCLIGPKFDELWNLQGKDVIVKGNIDKKHGCLIGKTIFVTSFTIKEK